MRAVPGFWQPWWSDETIADAIRSASGLALVWEDNRQIRTYARPARHIGATIESGSVQAAENKILWQPDL